MDVYDLFLTLPLTLLIIFISYSWYKNYKLEKKLQWIPRVPGYPIIGTALDFKSPADILPNFDRYMKLLNSKTICSKMLNRYGILTKDYKLLEYVSSSNTILDKADTYKFLHNWLGTGLLTADGKKWRPRRKIITPAFHFGVLEQFVEVFDRNGRILIEKLEKQTNTDSVNIYLYITLCALDIICETAMGVSVHAQTKVDSEYVKCVKNMCAIVMKRSFSPIKFNNVTYKYTEDYQTEKNALKVLHGYTTSVINARIDELKKKSNEIGEQTNDFGVKKKTAFLDLLLKSTINGEPLSKEDIREEVDTFMFEGHDTTASAMSFALYCLANNPDVQKLALEEQKDIFGDDFNRPTTHRDLIEMKYLEMVIKETLRLYPSVPFYARNVTENMEFDGNIIPKGVRITLYIYGFNRDPEYYPDPERFNPSRFEEVDRKPYSFLSFSAGARNCIGQKFAMLEMKCTISKVLRNFQLLPATPEHKLELSSETVLKSKNGINIKLKKRS